MIHTKEKATLVTAAIAFAMLAFGSLTAPTNALAVCGDGVVDAGELCDDGNLADGDCCSAICGRADYCIPTGKSRLIFRDLGDDRIDKVIWSYSRGETALEDFGNPLADTGYAFCIWDDDRLVVDSFIENSGFCYPNRPCWRVRGRIDPRGYIFFDRNSNDTGVQRFYITRKRPPANAFIDIVLNGIDINPPGPVAFDQYFNQTSEVRVQLLRDDAPICWEASFFDFKINDNKRFKSFLTPQKVAGNNP